MGGIMNQFKNKKNMNFGVFKCSKQGLKVEKKIQKNKN